ncbi:ABC transporter substrate-binding protein [Uliginosibacterium sp. 31-16]|uniref:ABC transporter substrate-binding protein n=1 Tax=Uliginosibacterium sp. 31-16 TaxID=3068315 RepID=UPI00273D86AC|nr:ABC transporter substrate-binding protein [Uliginosibacterium sp. 31-16]MDP5240045.1 ABC transporter substrate-binding protein [Uliginosibacterium sp. 31-16]
MFRLGAAVLALTLSGSALAQEAPIRIGVVGPFSGKSSTDMGESIRGGARVFADEVNRFGGLLGRRIELVERDDQALPDVGVKVARELIEKEKVAAVVGFANIGVATRVAPIFQQAKVPLIISAAAGGDITKTTNAGNGVANYVFRLAGRDLLQTQVMVKDVVERRKISAVAVLHDTSPYGESGKANVLAELTLRNIKPVVIETFKVGDQDMSQQLARARDAGAKAVLIYGLASEDAAVARGMAKMKWAVPLVGTWTMSQQTFIEQAGPAGEGARAAVTFIEDEQRGPRYAFAKAYRKLNNVPTIPSGVAAAQTYDALRLIYLAIFQANGWNGERIQHALETLDMQASSTVVTRFKRPFAYDDHEAISDSMVVMAEIRAQKLAYAYPEDETAALLMRNRR